MPTLVLAFGKGKKGAKPTMPPPEMPKTKTAGKPPARLPAPPPKRTGETEADEMATHDLGEKFSAERLLFHDGSETCANCHHFDGEAGTCKIGAVEISDPEHQGCWAGYDSAEQREELQPAEEPGEGEAA